ncbi:MAG: hypothetical protein HWE39_03580 [Oceanospirillaceae bacterium]|nr:hypothetical protein [Oceanospirillaceae bacterium]
MNHLRKVVACGLALYALPALAEPEWRFNLTPYLWFAGLEGDVGIVGLPPAPVDISASDALDDTETSLMVLMSAKKGSHGIFADLFYADVRSEEELVPDPVNLKAKTTTKTTIATLAYQYELYNSAGAAMDLLAGGRYWNVDGELRFKGGLGMLAGQKRSDDDSWIDPLLGFKGHWPLGSSRFFLAGGGAVGGFGVGSDSFYEINANIGYQWTDAIGTGIGYRIIDVDYDEDDFVYDARQEGWQIGLIWTF